MRLALVLLTVTASFKVAESLVTAVSEAAATKTCEPSVTKTAYFDKLNETPIPDEYMSVVWDGWSVAESLDSGPFGSPATWLGCNETTLAIKTKSGSRYAVGTGLGGGSIYGEPLTGFQIQRFSFACSSTNTELMFDQVSACTIVVGTVTDNTDDSVYTGVDASFYGPFQFDTGDPCEPAKMTTVVLNSTNELMFYFTLLGGYGSILLDNVVLIVSNDCD